VDSALAARRLSGALGRKVTPEDVEDIQTPYDGLTVVTVKADRLPWLQSPWPFASFSLWAGNLASDGVRWIKNGRDVDRDSLDEVGGPRPLGS
jgi:hypothetical protein